MTKRYPHSELEQEVLNRLLELGFSVASGQRVGGYEPDLVVTTADGRKIIVEVKGWAGDPAHIDRAKQQVRLYQKALGADAGFVVMPNLRAGRPLDGVLSIDDLQQLPSLIANVAHHDQQRESASARGAAHNGERIVFAAMPFAPAFDDVFFVAMTHAAEQIGATCKRVDYEEFSGDIVIELKRLIETSVAVIADLSGARPNVLYELGYAQGLSRPTVHITSTPATDLPFDVRNWSVLSYVTGQTHKLRQPLQKRLQAALGDS
jgi:hypothetical protein